MSAGYRWEVAGVVVEAEILVATFVRLSTSVAGAPLAALVLSNAPGLWSPASPILTK